MAVWGSWQTSQIRDRPPEREKPTRRVRPPQWAQVGSPKLSRRGVEGWARAAPEGFLFALEASRYPAHIRRLREPREPVHRLMRLLGPLGEHLGPILLQLPPRMPCDPSALDAAPACSPDGVRVAVEPRDPSWFSAPVRVVLERRAAASCLADRPGRHAPYWRTVDWGYVRFHEGRATPRPCYGRAALASWARRLAGPFAPGENVFAFFNNDPDGCAPRDARVFAGLAAANGRAPTRVPGSRETPVGDGVARRTPRGGRPCAKAPASGYVGDMAGRITQEAPAPIGAGIERLRQLATSCTACPLHEAGTRTVFGEGPTRARIMLVGEMPGDREDLEGRPFVGPAGRVLDRALAEAGIRRDAAYLTNAVKHFKWVARGRRRIHDTPNERERVACRPWLHAEIVAVSPLVVVCLGATAARSVLGPDFRITRDRGELFALEGADAMATGTLHPAAVLRDPRDRRAELFAGVVEDLRRACAALGDA